MEQLGMIGNNPLLLCLAKDRIWNSEEQGGIVQHGVTNDVLYQLSYTGVPARLLARITDEG